ncbi:MAG: hypothetical protein M1829_006490 [Trizodia sp. TS-e1964]|nr:MAG: hypothetical protein M1829_006490 [Trizodia sp. TS-e1964]
MESQPPPLLINSAIKFPPPHRRSHSRSPSRSPTRLYRFSLHESDNLLSDLSPTTTLEALSTSPTFSNPGEGRASDALKASIAQASAVERAFGVRAAVASSKVREWYRELSAWEWPANNGTNYDNGFDVESSGRRATKRRKLGSIREQPQLILEDLPEIGEDPQHLQENSCEEFWGSLPATLVMEYEDRIDEIREDMAELDVEELKSKVLDAHIPARSRPSSSYSQQTDPPPPFFTHTPMSDFTAVTTATIIQALPTLSRLSKLLETWTIRLLVLRQVPLFLHHMEKSAKAMLHGWSSLRTSETPRDFSFRSCTKQITQTSPPQVVFLEDDPQPQPIDPELGLSSNKYLTRENFDRLRSLLESNITALGQQLDYMLDTLEGCEETIPNHWIVGMEALEADYGEWVVEGGRLVLENEWRKQAEQDMLEKVHHVPIPSQVFSREIGPETIGEAHLRKGEPLSSLSDGLQDAYSSNADRSAPSPQQCQPASDELIDDHPHDPKDTDYQFESVSPAFPIRPVFKIEDYAQMPNFRDGSADQRDNDSMLLQDLRPVIYHTREMVSSFQSSRDPEATSVELDPPALPNHRALSQSADPSPQTDQICSRNLICVESREIPTTPSRPQLDIGTESTPNLSSIPQQQRETSESSEESHIAFNSNEDHPSGVETPQSSASSYISDTPSHEILHAAVVEVVRSHSRPTSITGSPNRKAARSSIQGSLLNSFDTALTEPPFPPLLKERGRNSSLSTNQTNSYTGQVLENVVMSSSDELPSSPKFQGQADNSAPIVTAVSEEFLSPDLIEDQTQRKNVPSTEIKAVAPPAFGSKSSSPVTSEFLESFNLLDFTIDPSNLADKSDPPQFDYRTSSAAASPLSPKETQLKKTPPPLEAADNNNSPWPISYHREAIVAERAMATFMEVVPKGEVRRIDVRRRESFSSASPSPRHPIDSRRSYSSSFEPTVRDPEIADLRTPTSITFLDHPTFSSVFPSNLTPEYPSPDQEDTSPSVKRVERRLAAMEEQRSPIPASSPTEPSSPPLMKFRRRSVSGFPNDESSGKIDQNPISDGSKSSQSPIKSTAQDLQKRISTILTTIPTKIHLTSETDSSSVVESSITSSSVILLPGSKPAKASARSSSFTLAPAYGKNSRARPQVGNPDIKLYHLRRHEGEAPIKLFVRLVGENGERVMVRVGGGWADLGEYLKEWASHHGHRSTSDGRVEIIHDIPNLQARSSATPKSGALSGRATPISRPGSSLDRPGSSLNVRKNRMALDASLPLSFRSPSTPIYASGRGQEMTPSSVSSNPNLGSVRPSSRLSWTDEEPVLGLAGPTSRKADISAEKQAWVNGMIGQVRQASAEKRREVDWGEMGALGGTKRLWRKEARHHARLQILLAATSLGLLYTASPTILLESSSGLSDPGPLLAARTAATVSGGSDDKYLAGFLEVENLVAKADLLRMRDFVGASCIQGQGAGLFSVEAGG